MYRMKSIFLEIRRAKAYSKWVRRLTMDFTSAFLLLLEENVSY